MTPAERELLLVLARDLVVSAQDQGDIRRLIATIEAKTPPLLPRAKHVKIVTAREGLKDVAQRWKNYRMKDGGTERDGEIHAALVALGPNPEPDDVARAGAPGWAYLSCTCCDNATMKTGLTFTAGYGDETGPFCFVCIGEATQLIEAVKEDNHGNR